MRHIALFITSSTVDLLISWSIWHCSLLPPLLTCSYHEAYGIVHYFLHCWLAHIMKHMALFITSSTVDLLISWSIWHCSLLLPLLTCSYHEAYGIVQYFLHCWLAHIMKHMALFISSSTVDLLISWSIWHCSLLLPLLTCSYHEAYGIVHYFLHCWLAHITRHMALFITSSTVDLLISWSIWHCSFTSSLLTCSYHEAYGIVHYFLHCWLAHIMNHMALFITSSTVDLLISWSIWHCSLLPPLLTCSYREAYGIVHYFLHCWLAHIMKHMALFITSSTVDLLISWSIWHCSLLPPLLTCSYHEAYGIVRYFLHCWLAHIMKHMALFITSSTVDLLISWSIWHCSLFPSLLTCSYHEAYGIVHYFLHCWLAHIMKHMALFITSSTVDLLISWGIWHCSLLPPLLTCSYHEAYGIVHYFLHCWLAHIMNHMALFITSSTVDLLISWGIWHCSLLLPLLHGGLQSRRLSDRYCSGAMFHPNSSH